MKADFKIVEAWSAKILAEDVTSLLQEGYQLHGFTEATPLNNSVRYHQAMVKLPSKSRAPRKVKDDKGSS